MKVTEISIDKLIPYWNNARENDNTIERLVKSIQEYGFNTPLVVNKDMVLITGHARLKALRKLGIKTVPCVVLNLTDEQAKKYRIADNKIQELTEWNEEALFKELREIGDQFELLDMGFSSKDLERIIGEQQAFSEQFDVEVYPEVGTETVPVEDYKPQVKTPQFAPEQKRDIEEINKQLKKRERELSGQYVRESHLVNAGAEIVTCPHCLQKFTIKRNGGN